MTRLHSDTPSGLWDHMALRRSKVLATLGPASASPESVRSLVEAGVDAFRVNASHLSPVEVLNQVRAVRETVAALGVPIPVVVDLQGPKLRLAALSEPICLTSGVRLPLSWPEHPSSEAFCVPISFDPFKAGLEVGHRVLFHDGRVEAVVHSVASHEGHLRMELIFPSGGTLESRKGVNLPDTYVPTSALTDDDRAVVASGLEAGCEWFALSFVQTADDVRELRALVGDRARVMAKIERPQAMQNLESIALASDALLVARGDLGVELPFEEVPLAQREVWYVARRAGRPVVCATEMLESMITSSRPTRAEATDVSSAVLDAFDSLMLSAETAIGHDPVAAVSAMRRIASAVEASARFDDRLQRLTPFQDANPERAAVAAAAVRLARDTKADAIVALTASGFTAGLLSACRPNVPVIAVTPSSRTAAQMNLLWGIHPLVAPRPDGVESAGREATRAAVDAGLIPSGAKVVVCGSRVGPTSDADAVWVQRA